MTLAAIPDHQLRDTIPEHRAELIRRGLRACTEALKRTIAHKKELRAQRMQ